MCAGRLVHIPRHLSRTSNNKRCQLIIRCVFCNSGRMDLDYDNKRYMVYRWGFSCLDYSFDVLISWNRKLGCTAGFVVIAFIGFYFGFLFLFLLYYYIIYVYILTYYLCTTPTSLLLLSYYSMHVSCLISLIISPPAHVCLCSRYGDWDFTCTQKYRISNLKNRMCKLSILPL